LVIRKDSADYPHRDSGSRNVDRVRKKPQVLNDQVTGGTFDRIYISRSHQVEIEDEQGIQREPHEEEL
jgi:hypothetical protein